MFHLVDLWSHGLRGEGGSDRAVVGPGLLKSRGLIPQSTYSALIITMCTVVKRSTGETRGFAGLIAVGPFASAGQHGGEGTLPPLGGARRADADTVATASTCWSCFRQSPWSQGRVALGCLIIGRPPLQALISVDVRALMNARCVCMAVASQGSGGYGAHGPVGGAAFRPRRPASSVARLGAEENRMVRQNPSTFCFVEAYNTALPPP